MTKAKLPPDAERLQRAPGVVQMCQRCHRRSADAVFEGLHLCSACEQQHSTERKRGDRDRR